LRSLPPSPPPPPPPPSLFRHGHHTNLVGGVCPYGVATRPVLGARRTIRGSSPLATPAPGAGASNVGRVVPPRGLTAAPLSRTRARRGCTPRRQARRRPSMMPRTEAGRPWPRMQGATPCTPHWQTAPCCLGMRELGVLGFSLHRPGRGRGWGLSRWPNAPEAPPVGARGLCARGYKTKKRSGGRSAPLAGGGVATRQPPRWWDVRSRRNRCAPVPRPAPGEPAGRGAGASGRGRVSNSRAP